MVNKKRQMTKFQMNVSLTILWNKILERNPGTEDFLRVSQKNGLLHWSIETSPSF